MREKQGKFAYSQKIQSLIVTGNSQAVVMVTKISQKAFFVTHDDDDR